METISLINILSIVALALLLVISGGIIYLTTLEWRDRRLQSRDKKSR